MATARTSRTKARASASGAGNMVSLHFTDIVEKVRRVPYDWPFPLSVPEKGGIVRNQTVKAKRPAPTAEELGEALL